MVLSNGHELWLGEATSSTAFEPLKRFNWLGELAELLPAYGVQTCLKADPCFPRLSVLLKGLTPRR